MSWCGGGEKHHALLARADRRNVLVHLGTRQLPSLARLGALRDLDFDLLRRHQVRGCHAEAAGSDLLDLGDGDVAVAQALKVRERV